MMTDAELARRARQVKLAVFDVDGVMTDGGIRYDSNGNEQKIFNILDGLGIKLLKNSGVDVAIITGRVSIMVQRRADELGIKNLIQGREDKLTALLEFLKTHDASLGETGYLGDDLPDLAAIEACGLGMTVPNGHYYVKEIADGITRTGGGKGAVREFCELIMSAQGTIDKALLEYRLASMYSDV